METITIKIHLSEMQTQGNMAQQERWLNDQLRKVGIPVRGVFTFDGVERGQLIIDPVNFHDNTMLFHWTEGPLTKVDI